MELRPYQAEAKRAILSEWHEGHRKTLLVLCTGLGKTIVFSSVTEHQVKLGHRVLIMAHRGELLSQAADKLKMVTGLDAAFEQGESHSLGSFLPVTVGSVQSLCQEKRLSMFPEDYFQDIIVDEAHHCLSGSYQRVLEHFPEANILGVTATPDRGDKQTLGRFFDSQAYEYSMSRAIREGYLSPVKARMIPLKLDISQAGISGGDYSATDIGYALEPYLAQIAKVMAEHCRGRKTVVFLPLIATSQKFCQMLNEVGLKAAEVNGMSEDRAENLTDFENGKFPIAALVHSGGKSLHAIVRVDAENYEEYRKRVEFLYDFMEKQGVPIDKQNRNPSRLSRMPGLTRNGNRQYLAATNIGRKSWTEWMDYVEGVTDELPPMVSLAEYKENPPLLPEELIQGILRRGHKMIISGSSKAGKSFLLMELCVAIAEGTKWLGFPCRKGRVLYVNLEIDPASCINRFLKIYDALGLSMQNADSIAIWNLRGHAVPLDQLVPKLVRRVRDQHFDAIVIDPIYKVITGDENNASDMGRFCNQFDKICTETGCSTIYCHHHSKGAQGAKKAIDHASSSGVFARDPDAQLDMIQLELSDDIKNNVRDGHSTAWRLESSLREFPNIEPLNFWFEYPVHRIDADGVLGEMPAQGSFAAGRMKNSHSKTAEVCAEEFRSAYQALNMDGSVTVQDMMEYLNITDKTVYARLKKMNGEFILKKGRILKNDGASKASE